MNMTYILTLLNNKIMKKLIVIAFCLIVVQSNAQIKQGTKYLEGAFSANFSSSKIDYPKQPNQNYSNNGLSLGISSAIKVFTRDNYAMNYGVSFGTSKYTSSTTTTSSNSLSVYSGFQRYTNLNSKFSVYYGMSGSLSLPISKTSDGYRNFSISASLADIGVLYQLNEKFSIEGGGSMASVSLGYGKMQETDKTGKKFSFGGGVRMPSIGFGLLYNLK
jgi:hypothetical protein